MPDFCPDERVKVATNVGSLAQLCFRGGGTLQTKHTGLCGEHLQWMDHTEVATAPGSMHLPSPSCSGSWGHREDTVPGGLCISLGELVSGYDTAGRYEPSRTPGRRGERLAACPMLGGKYGPWGCSGHLPFASGCPAPVSLPSGRATNCSCPLLFVRV